MKVKRIELKSFKRFSHLIVEGLPVTTKVVVLVGSNGSGKTSFLESMNHFYKYSAFSDVGDYKYLLKTENGPIDEHVNWIKLAQQVVDIDFYDATFQKKIGVQDTKGHFYFRSAYRNEPDFEIRSMQKQMEPNEYIRLQNLIQNDQTVSSNYQRLVANTISGVYDKNNDKKTVEKLREELIGVIRDSIERMFGDLKFTSIGDPLSNGNFFFSKGTSKNFRYCNLSAGEKSAFDLVLDIAIQSKYFPNAIYCIDEPEAHMHTRLQGKVLRELYLLLPGQSQLWISTHSIGMLQEAEQIEKEHPGTVAFLDFDGRDYDTDQIMRPAKINRAILDKFYELAFGDFAKLLLPRTIVFCEGDPNGGKRKDYDKTIYTIIFGDKHPEAHFISGGSCNEIETIEDTHGEIIRTLLSNSRIIKIVDRDDMSEQEVKDLSDKRINVLQRRNLESYLLCDEVIRKLCENVGKADEYEECMKEKQCAIEASINRGNAVDDLKSARGEIYNALKHRLGITQCGNNADSFLRDTIAPLITPDMEIYKELESEIFGRTE